MVRNDITVLLRSPETGRPIIGLSEAAGGSTPLAVRHTPASILSPGKSALERLTPDEYELCATPVARSQLSGLHATRGRAHTDTLATTSGSYSAHGTRPWRLKDSGTDVPVTPLVGWRDGSAGTSLRGVSGLLDGTPLRCYSARC